MDWLEEQDIDILREFSDEFEDESEGEDFRQAIELMNPSLEPIYNESQNFAGEVVDIIRYINDVISRIKIEIQNINQQTSQNFAEQLELQERLDKNEKYLEYLENLLNVFPNVFDFLNLDFNYNINIIIGGFEFDNFNESYDRFKDDLMDLGRLLNYLPDELLNEDQIRLLLKLYELGSEYIQIYQNNLQQSQLSLYPQYLPLSGMMEPSYSVPSTSYRSTTRRNI